MSATTTDPTTDRAEETSEPTRTTDLEVRRHVPLAAGLGITASVLAIAYLVRASGTGAPLDWALCALMAVVGGLNLAALLDARSPLLVADAQGLRVRRGRVWHGLPWSDVDRVEHLARRGLLRDGRLDVIGNDGTDWAVRLGLATRVVGAGDDLAEALLERSDWTADVVEIDLVPAEALVEDAHDEHDEHDKHDTTPEPEAEVVEVVEPVPLEEPTVETPVTDAPVAEKAPAFASPTPGPLRTLVNAARFESRREAAPEPVVEEPQRETVHLIGARDATPVREQSEATIVIDDTVSAPVPDPVVGPQLAAARTRIGLGVDQLAERTRIRPHVIESIEVDDFGPCGGDFYARGHLRTLARVLGVDAAPLLASYDERYADAPVDPRRVFEAELATGAHGPIRGTRGGPNWSVLVAAVMAVVLIWSIARLAMDGPVQMADTPRLNQSSGINNGTSNAGPKVPVVLTATGGGAVVVVRDGSGAVVFDGDVAFMQTVELQVTPPVRVQSTDGSLTVSIDGEDRGALGATGQESQNTFVVRD
ncbi:helix-turn-helix transcriptional regulator [Nocardioides sp.]|uniref:helix-turn-helix domain-containing protein n=1 Tax=Nocardioides sp. TaxID=35761 RepID=UPI00286CF726|nr:helix-turn-helix transcriptional regulator [Nocardioides sp.]